MGQGAGGWRGVLLEGQAVIKVSLEAGGRGLLEVRMVLRMR